MQTSHPIFQEAIQIANGFTQRKLDFERDKAELQLKLKQVEAQLEAANLASKRLATFTMHRDGTEQCPRCWIAHEVAADLTPIPSDNRDDIFRCRSCGFEIAVTND